MWTVSVACYQMRFSCPESPNVSAAMTSLQTPLTQLAELRRKERETGKDGKEREMME